MSGSGEQLKRKRGFTSRTRKREKQRRSLVYRGRGGDSWLPPRCCCGRAPSSAVRTIPSHPFAPLEAAERTASSLRPMSTKQLRLFKSARAHPFHISLSPTFDSASSVSLRFAVRDLDDGGTSADSS